MARALITLPPRVAPGSVVEVKTLIAHPMETGHRTDAEGRLVPRDIVRRLRCEFNGELVGEAELFPAIAANPYLVFMLRATQSGTLSVRWEGDNGFVQTETVRLEVA
jgi:sulfur-oxidizing protein SoxZ